MRRAIGIVAVVLVVALASARAQTQVELILDASGSMWNRVADGRYRIDAAKDALTTFVRGLPDGGLDVGLRIYGSTVDALAPGACDDTRLFVPLSGVDKAGLQKAVDAVKARGATPIVGSLLAAAGDFSGTSGQRMIVLVTDGQESCGGDLAAAVAQLKAMQPPVALRVIGFDLPPKAAKTFSDLATFVNADDAATLVKALAGAVEAVAPAAPAASTAPAQVTLEAPDAVPAGTDYSVRWKGAPVAGDAVVAVPPGAPDDAQGQLLGYVEGVDHLAAVAPLEAGTLELRYLSVGTVAARRTLSVTPSPATLKVVDDAVFAGSTFHVAWTGPNGPKDYVTLVKPDAKAGDYGDYVYTRDGTTVAFVAPSDPGTYELRYQSDDDPGTVLARTRFEVLPPKPITLEALGEVIAGADFQVSWTGPDAVQDYITIVPKGAPDGDYTSYQYTRDGSPLTLTAPLAPGAYELRYSTDRADAKGRVYASYPITVVAAAITLTPAPEIHAGSPFDVQVSGPAHGQDYITIVAKGAPDGDYQAYAYVDQTRGTFSLLAPSQPGAYEIRYQNDNDPTRVLARTPVTVGQAIPVTLDAPDSADAGGQIEVRWTGPDGPQDYLTIVPKGAPEGDYGPYTYTADGSPLTLDVPSDPGAYEIRYQSDRTEIGVLGRRPLTVH